jgi:hypothetical protein
MTIEIVKPGHERWGEFCDRLSGPHGVNFRRGDDGEWRWDCNGRDCTYAERLLKWMGFSEESVKASLEFYRANGGYCDCEILFNVDKAHR